MSRNHAPGHVCPRCYRRAERLAAYHERMAARAAATPAVDQTAAAVLRRFRKSAGFKVETRWRKHARNRSARLLHAVRSVSPAARRSSRWAAKAVAE